MLIGPLLSNAESGEDFAEDFVGGDFAGGQVDAQDRTRPAVDAILHRHNFSSSISF